MDRIVDFKRINEIRLIRYSALLKQVDIVIKEIENIKSFNDNGFNDKPDFKQAVLQNIKNKEQTCEKLLHDAKNNAQIMLGHIMFDDINVVTNNFAGFNFLGTYNDFKELLNATKNYIKKYINENKTEYKTLVLGNLKVIKCLKKCINCYTNVFDATRDYVENFCNNSEKQL